MPEAVPSNDSATPTEADLLDPSIEAPTEMTPVAKRSPVELLRVFYVKFKRDL